jgi:hypothetical protein
MDHPIPQPHSETIKLCRGLLLVMALVAVDLYGLAGCVALNSRDRAFLGSHDISAALYTKMSRHEPLTLDDIIELSHKKVPGPFIVHYLRPTYYVYKLKFSDVSQLRSAGVDEGVIRYLLSTPGMYSPASAPVWYDDNPNLYDTHPGLGYY